MQKAGKAVIVLIVFLFSTFITAQDKSGFEGEYQIRPGFNIVISQEGGDLYVEPTGKPKEKLTPVNESLYRVESIDGTIDFSLLEKNGVAVINMYGRTIHAPEFPVKKDETNYEKVDVPEARLKQYTGKYSLSAKEIFTVTIDDEKLLVQLTGQSGFPVYNYAPDKFYYKDVEATLEFVKDKQSKVKYLLLKQNSVIMQADKI